MKDAAPDERHDARGVRKPRFAWRWQAWRDRAEGRGSAGPGIPGCVLAAVSASDLSRRPSAFRIWAPGAGRCARRTRAARRHRGRMRAVKTLPVIAEPFPAAQDRDRADAGAILSHEHLIGLARRHSGQIVVPTGRCLPGRRDGGSRGRNPQRADGHPQARARPRGSALSRRTQHPHRGHHRTLAHFTGTAREAAIGFPANLNVAVALSLAGSARTRRRWRYGPTLVTRNTHRIEVDSDRLRSRCRSKTSRRKILGPPHTALSVISYLRKLGAPLRWIRSLHE